MLVTVLLLVAVTGGAAVHAARERHAYVLEAREAMRRRRYPPLPPPSNVRIIPRNVVVDWEVADWPETREDESPPHCA